MTQWQSTSITGHCEILDMDLTHLSHGGMGNRSVTRWMQFLQILSSHLDDDLL